jgi:sporulation protein YlmC with PRC-barrel domain
VSVVPAQPQVQVQPAQPRVVVQQPQGQPQIRYEQQGQPVVTMQQQAAAAGASGAGAAPAQAGGGAQNAAASPAAAGVPLQRAQSLVGTNVVGANGRDAGEVENLLIDRNGQVRAAVVEWGGFLGIGENRAVVPIDQIQLGAGNNERARMTLTREQLERLPRYDRNNIAEYGTRYGWGEGLRLFR